jgi:hypothetical protein
MYLFCRSLPPIINGEHSKLKKDTIQDVFVECTATDLTKANVRALL